MASRDKARSGSSVSRKNPSSGHNLRVREGAKPGGRQGGQIDSRQSQNAGNLRLSLETGPERYRKSRSKRLLDLILAD
jgi:hypothetical protein